MTNLTDSIKNPFSLYDFFGYLFPGVFFLSLIMIFAHIICPTVLDGHIDNILVAYKGSTIIKIIFVVSALVFTYATGHIVAMLSHIFIDRILVAGIVGYPISKILAKNTDRIYQNTSYKLFFVFVNIFCLAPLVECWGKLEIYSNVAWLLSIVILVKITKSVVSKDWWNQINVSLLGGVNSAARYLTSITIDRLILSFERLIQTNKGMSSEFVDAYLSKFNKDFKFPDKYQILSTNTEHYWLSFYKISSEKPIHTSMLFNWLHLYAFSRNLAVSCFTVLFGVSLFLYIDDSYVIEHSLAFMMIIIFIAGWLFLMRYWMLYSTYYSKGVLRAFMVTGEDNQK